MFLRNVTGRTATPSAGTGFTKHIEAARLPYAAQGKSARRRAERVEARAGEARRALGAAFDWKAFHAAVLGIGALQMTASEEHVDRFVEQSR